MKLSDAIRRESNLAHEALSNDDLALAFHQFDRLHVLGQYYTGWHVGSHIGMLRIGWRRRDAREVIGQIARIIAAALLSRIWLPRGNTGGANVSPFAPMAIPDDLRAILDGAG